KEYNTAILPQLQTICEPLKVFGISSFAYAKITKDQSFFRIGTHEEYTQLFFERGLYNQVEAYRGLLHAETFSKESKTLFFLWNPVDGAGQTRTFLGMGNGISIYHITKEYIEGCAFGGTVEDTGLINFYLNNMDLLKKFFNCFKNSAKDIIDICDKTKTIDIVFHEKYCPCIIDPEKIHEFNKKIGTHKYRITEERKEFILSPREIECLYYKSRGLSAKETARECKLSPRTVEGYMDNIKAKSGIRNVTHLISLCKGEGLL
ncbi:MAG: LuxR C-terminal-related transcriptional regulator, partial [Alphaproteobacteria bacterium]|nr:LuxR C-terminal-related transcriptional regulator [Alphaproteobacteria bacterium]